ncbi:Solitary outer membrane autotransporter beta-barrel domain, partial [Vibrio parahaemolyticus]|uniref:Solitary outer membrane autotransporter beta-barrel domain n=1 Tax=Vibrio parahaemolyticus TaxID=670 RepID=UPI00146C0959
MFQPNFASVEWRVVSLALLLSLPHTANADPLDKEISNLLQQRFSIAVLLSDTDAIAFGIGDFDPNALFDTANPEFGTEESINERRSKPVYVLPYTT